MKKLLIIALLFVGCDYAPTEHTHEHEHDTTHEHDDIYGCTDSTATNFDSTATIFDNTCAYPNTVFEVDWILIKQLGASERFEISGEVGSINVVDTGYVFIHTDSSNVNITSEPPCTELLMKL